jgi:hypothetical protein
VHDKECAYCTDPLAAGKSYAKTAQMELGRDLFIPQTTSSQDESSIVDAVVDYIQAEIDKKIEDPSYIPVNWLWTGNSVFSSSLVGKGAAAAQDVIQSQLPPEQRWTLHVMANNWGIGETTPEICGAACNNIFYGLFPVPRYGDSRNAIGMDQMMRIHDEYRQKDGHPIEQYRDVRYVQGHAAALMWRKAVEAAIDAGNNSPTGEDLKNALESFQQVELDGMTAGPISFSPTDHRPQFHEAVYKIDNNDELEFVNSFTIPRDQEFLGY